jgi:hypothetical protein
MATRLRLIVNNVLGISKDRYDPERDGVSPTLLSNWKSCREKARLRILGWKSRRMRGSMIFGTLAHAVLERIYGKIQNGKIGTVPSESVVLKVCREVEAAWRRDNPRADDESLQEMERQMLLVEAVMPQYFIFWSKDLVRMDWFHLEQFVGDEAKNRSFGKLPSGREAMTHLKGKMDGAFKSNKDKKGRLWLFETKSRSVFSDDQQSNLMDILPHECQTTLYLGALQDANKGQVPGGVLYNIIRRPGLRQKKNESLKAFGARVKATVQAKPDFFFLRFRMELDSKEFAKQRNFTDALIKDFIAWYHGEVPHYLNSDNCETKFGPCEFLKMCSRRDTTGMYQSKPRRSELEEQ